MGTITFISPKIEKPTFVRFFLEKYMDTNPRLTKREMNFYRAQIENDYNNGYVSFLENVKNSKYNGDNESTCTMEIISSISNVNPLWRDKIRWEKMVEGIRTNLKKTDYLLKISKTENVAEYEQIIETDTKELEKLELLVESLKDVPPPPKPTDEEVKKLEVEIEDFIENLKRPIATPYEIERDELEEYEKSKYFTVKPSLPIKIPVDTRKKIPIRLPKGYEK